MTSVHSHQAVGTEPGLVNASTSIGINSSLYSSLQNSQVTQQNTHTQVPSSAKTKQVNKIPGISTANTNVTAYSIF